MALFADVGLETFLTGGLAATDRKKQYNKLQEKPIIQRNCYLTSTEQTFLKI
jgi:hypothetical protein